MARSESRSKNLSPIATPGFPAACIRVMNFSPPTAATLLAICGTASESIAGPTPTYNVPPAVLS